MSDTSKTIVPVAESQKERWLKYGANVALVILVAILLAGLLVYIAQKNNWRKDTTAGGAYSLKPQTVKLIKDLPQKVKLVGLFSRAKENTEKKVQDQGNNAEVRYQQVADLLQEYQQKSGGKISFEMIDPDSEPTKVDQLFNEVTEKYGNDVKRHDEVMKDFKPTVEKISKLASDELVELQKLPDVEDRKINQIKRDVVVTAGLFPELLKQLQIDVKKQQELKVPDRKGAADAIKERLSSLNEMVDAVLRKFKTAREDAKTPQPFKDYMTASTPRFESMKKAADELLKKMEGLGELKQLDELRQNKKNSIAVMAETDMKVLPANSIFRTENVRAMDAGGNIKPRFAGEQQISTALVSLTVKEKKKVAIIRSGGPPMAMSLPMFNYTGPMNDVIDRLREYNVEVLEKDISGAWAMQAMQFQMQGMPLPPEPGDEQLKDALWIVLVSPEDPRAAMRNPQAGQLLPKVQEHLKNGGSAMLLFSPQADKMEFLKEYGIAPRPDYLMVHEKIEPQGARSEDYTLDWQRQQPVFVLNDYGDHMVTRPLRSLDLMLIPLIPVNTVDAKGVKTTKILPIPQTPKAWGEGDFDSVRGGKLVEYNVKKDDKEGDLPAPLWGGAMAETDKGQRIAVIGSREFAFNDWVNQPDIEILKNQRRYVPRFPGNAELFVNSVFWLAKMDTMIAISPTTLEVPRIAPIGDTALVVWRVVVLIVGLPLLVLAAGTFVWLKRRD